MLVLDTSALLYWTMAPERLTKRASTAIDGSSALLVSAISLWEIGVKAAKGKLQIPVSIREYSERLSLVERVEILDVDLETWLMNLDLAWEHRDPADRTIVATASLRGCPLVTSDGAILDFYSDSIW
ncbi:MAG: type II toxin-antitoxin system VapC family toxin [Vulcanimicrobiota bacterium]